MKICFKDQIAKLVISQCTKCGDYSLLLLSTISGCLNGEIILMNGSTPSNGSEGRVEICYNNTYGSVCDDLWDEQAARVVCGGIGKVPLQYHP